MPPHHHKHDFWEGLFANSLPRTHLFAAGLVALSMVVGLVLVPSEPVSAYRETSLQQLRSGVASSKSKMAVSLDEAILDVSSRPDPDLVVQIDEKVRRGDNLTSIFQRMSLDQSEALALANTEDFADELRNLRPGEIFSVVLTPENQIKEVVYERSKLESYRYTPFEQGYHGKKLSRNAKTVATFRQVTIEHSLFQDGDKAGLSHAQILQIANIFGWDIDFALDLREGDTFNVLFEEQYLDGDKVGNGTILGAEFTNQGRTYEAVRYEDIDGESNYYTPEGQPMKKAFLLSPLDFTRVSSNFNPNRLHPILKIRRPHRGVDYAAPTGTPVYAAGKGRVVQSGYTASTGNFVAIQHNNRYITKYMHLSKRMVKVGQTVRQRQTIGAVGATGYATGAHLHYEFLVNGVHTDPRKVKMIQADPISKTEMARFRLHTAPLLAQLQSNQSNSLAAAASTQDTL